MNIKILQLLYFYFVSIIFSSMIMSQTNHIDKPPGYNYTSLDSLYSDTSPLKPDYRNHKNIPEYDPSLMPLNYNSRTTTGVWTELNPKVPRVNYLGIDFIDSLTGWAVGANGAIIKTTNGGENWETKQSGVTSILTHVNSYNGNVVIAVGFGGKILRSSDAGETWNSITSTAVADLWRVQMLNDSLGWICGRFYHLYKTTDGGRSWQSVSAGFLQDYWSLDFLNEDLGFISCGMGNLLKTTNGGTTWQQINIGEDVSLYCVTMLDDRTIVTGGFTRIAASYDGGNSWHIVGLGGIFYSIAFSDSLNGTALSDASVYRTTDRGISWNRLFGSPSAHNWVVFVDSLTGYYAGNSLKIQKTIDGGLTWQQLIFNDDFYDVHFINETTGFVLSGSLYKTTDGGNNWTKLEGKPGGYSIKFIDSLTGFIGNNNGSIVKTTNGGETWHSKHYNQPAGQIHKFLFINDSVGWALGGWVLKTTDRGETWIVKGGGGTSIFFIDSLVGWITRINGRPYKTTDGGETWVEQTSFPTNRSDDVYFLDNNRGYIISFQRLYGTSNGGISWNTEMNSQYVIRNLEFLTSNHGFVIGDAVFETKSGGENWEEIIFMRNVGVRKFQAPVTYLGYLIGKNGLIYKYIDSTYIPVELTSFSFEKENNTIVLKWNTATEVNNFGFEIQHSTNNLYWTPIGFISGKGTISLAQEYIFIVRDVELNSKKNFFRLKQIDFNGNFKYSKVISIEENSLSKSYHFFQNYPNPFNTSTVITFQIPFKNFVNISLFNIIGEKVYELINKELEAGIHREIFSNNTLSSGVYFLRMKTSAGFSAINKITLIK